MSRRRRRRKFTTEDEAIDEYEPFTEEPQSPIECEICTSLLVDPSRLRCCKNVICTPCTEKMTSCPFCRSGRLKARPAKNYRRYVNGLKFHCKHEEDGCPWVGTLVQLKDHLNENPDSDYRMKGCDFMLLKCRFCGEEMSRSLLRENEMSCSQCNFDTGQHKETDHFDCDSFQGTSIDSDSTQDSVLSSPEESVFPEAFSQMEVNHQMNKYRIEHSELLEKEISHLRNENKYLSSKIDQICAENAELVSANSQLSSDNKRLASSLDEERGETNMYQLESNRLFPENESLKAANKQLISELHYIKLAVWMVIPAVVAIALAFCIGCVYS